MPWSQFIEDRRDLEMTGSGGFAHPKSPTVVNHPGGDRKPSPQRAAQNSLCQWEAKGLLETTGNGFYLFLVLAFLHPNC